VRAGWHLAQLKGVLLAESASLLKLAHRLGWRGRPAGARAEA
jgi:hypothetical protein